jgi:pimeloyl-ACP methyl ester carboxylesterase
VIPTGWISSESSVSPEKILLRCEHVFLRSAGERTVKELNQRSQQALSGRLILIRNAGHQMMIDNPAGFHDAVEQALVDHRE